MSSADLSLLVRVLGFLTGIILYAMLAIMAWQGRLATRTVGGGGGTGDVSSAQPHRAELLLVIAALGLVVSIAASILHVSALLWPVPVHTGPWAWGVVAGYGVLMVLIAIHMWRLTAVQRLLSVIAILIFAASAAHLVYSSGQTESLGVELVVHNASLPLVAALLYQEYRFALADVFLKQAFSFILLVLIASSLYVMAQGMDQRVLLALWIATALAYPGLRWIVYLGVDRLILRRATAREVRTELAAAIATAETPEGVLDRACATLRQALTARWVTWRGQGEGSREGYPPSAQVVVPVTDVPRYVIEIGPLAGGRRLLSGDMDLLDGGALDIARRVDAIRITAERYERTTREAEVLRLATEAELRALHAQLNPHFLFNALTTIGYLIREAPDRAVDTLLRLTNLLRAVLRRSAGELVMVGEEIALVEAYLAIERARFEERLTISIQVPSMIDHLKIPPLVIQPLVENAIKHGIGPRAEGGTVSVSVSSSDLPEFGSMLIIRVQDTGIGATPTALARGRALGVGLQNITRRLEQYYRGEASLTVESTPGVGTIVEVRIPRQAA
jgi:signal transduction histidine kinase